MNTLSTLTMGTLACALLPGCLALPISDANCQHADCAGDVRASVPVQPVEAPRAEASTPDAWAQSLAEPSVLYARDGQPVESQPASVAMPSDSDGMLATRDVERPESGRLYLLELYQQAVDERDDLLDEVMRQEAFLLELQAANAALETQVAEVQAHSVEVEAEKKRAEEQSFELAGRLTAAQIGRLQAELARMRAENGMADSMRTQPSGMDRETQAEMADEPMGSSQPMRREP